MNNNSESCSSPDCCRPVYVRELCRRHYHKLRRYGDANGGRPGAKGEQIEFIRALTDNPPDECVIWPYYSPEGSEYGRIHFQGAAMGAHRASLIMAEGMPPTSNMQAAHNCGNPSCVNPKHLRWATAKSNQDDRKIHGTYLCGEDTPGSKLTEADIPAIRRDDRIGRVIANEYGVTQSNVSLIKRRKSWSWVE